MQRPSPKIVNASMALAWILWSTDPILIRLVGNQASRLFIAGMCEVLAGIMLFIPAIRGLKRLAGKPKTALLFICYALLFTALADIAYVYAVRHLNPGLVSLILRSQVVLAVLAAWVCFGEKPDKVTLCGIGVVVLGHIFGAYLSLTSAMANTGGQNSTYGWIFAISTALLWTGGTIAGKRIMELIPSKELCGARMLIAGMFTIIIVFASSGTREIVEFQPAQWGFLLLKTLVGTVIAYSLYLYGLKYSTVTVASAMEQAAPLFALIMSTCLLNESISIMQWISVVWVTLGAALIIIRNSMVR